MSSAEEIWSEALRTLERHEQFALATVINVRGSTPREVGAKMIVRHDGQFGTIGGGCGEAEVFRKARMLLEQGEGTRLTEVDLTGDFDQQEIGTCGGIMDVFIDLWSASGELQIARRLAEAARRSRPAALVTLVDPGGKAEPPAGARVVVDPIDPNPSLPIPLPDPALAQIVERTSNAVPMLLEVSRDGRLRSVTRIAENGAPRVFLDPVTAARRLIIAGAGHIAQPLATIGSMLGFHVTVVDDRGAFANRERFPSADEIIVRPFTAAIESLNLGRNCYLVSMTRGHAFDEAVVRAALKYPDVGFIGMIGSRRRVALTLEHIGQSGVPEHRLQQVHAPLGLDLGAETPEEIAVSIAAELIRERRTGIRDDFTLGAKLGRLRPCS